MIDSIQNYLYLIVLLETIKVSAKTMSSSSFKNVINIYKPYIFNICV